MTKRVALSKDQLTDAIDGYLYRHGLVRIGQHLNWRIVIAGSDVTVRVALSDRELSREEIDEALGASAEDVEARSRGVSDDMLPCPECRAPAISMREPEHTERDCPGCGLRLRSNVTGDHTGDWWEAEIVEDDDE